MTSTVVIARYNEDVSWADNIPNKFIVQKDEHLPNIGRESSSYLWYIINNYDTLKGKYFFLQGKVLDHCPNIHEELKNTEGAFRWFSNRVNFKCDLMGRPHDSINITEFLSKCNMQYDRNEIVFNGCALFMISAEQLRKRPKEFYEHMYNVLMEPNNRWAYAFERCVGIIFRDI